MGKYGEGRLPDEMDDVDPLCSSKFFGNAAARRDILISYHYYY